MGETFYRLLDESFEMLGQQREHPRRHCSTMESTTRSHFFPFISNKLVAMLLLELPPELLLVLYENLPDIRTLYNLTRTCTYARAVYLEDSLSILTNVVHNAYSDLSDSVQDTISASRSHGELDYAYINSHRVEWIVPAAANPWTPSKLDTEGAMDLLQDLADLENDTEMLADWFTPLCQFKASWHCEPGLSIRDSVVRTLLRLRLVTNRLYNVRLPAFPEHISLRTYEKDKKQSLIAWRRPSKFSPFLEDQIRTIGPNLRDTCSFSRKTREQAQDLMKDHLRTISLPHLRNMWFLMQMLQDEYLLLRRHRLRPRPGSLMDLLFEHNSNDTAWSPSPWFSVQSLLSDMGVHVVPARPGTSFRFLGHETSHELQQKDLAEFMHYHDSARWPQINCDGSQCLGRYLERFRPLLGLAYFDSSLVQDLVEHKAPIRSAVGANRYWAHASSTTVGQSHLGNLLQECGEKNYRKSIARSKLRLRMGRKDSITE